jgi:hypothetical protein
MRDAPQKLGRSFGGFFIGIEMHHWLNPLPVAGNDQEMLLVSAGRSPACWSASNSNHRAFKIANAQASPRPKTQLKYHMIAPQ